MSCLFCRIASGEIPASIVYQDDQTVAFRDINPQAPVHLLIIPKQHLSGLNQVSAENAALAGHLLEVARRLASAEGLAESGYRVVANSGPDAGQSVPHLHFHLLGGRGLAWPPG